MTTETPRTDEEMWTTDYHHELCNVVNTEFAQQLERELTEAKAEVERLRSQLERAVEIARGFCGCGCGGDYGLCNFCADQFSELDEIKATLNQTDK